MTPRERLLPSEETEPALWMAGLLALATAGLSLAPYLGAFVPVEHGPNALPEGWLGAIVVAFAAAVFGALIVWSGSRFGAPRASFGFLVLIESWMLVAGVLRLGSSFLSGPNFGVQLSSFASRETTQLALLAGITATLWAMDSRATSEQKSEGSSETDGSPGGPLHRFGLADRDDRATGLALWAALLFWIPSAASIIYGYLTSPVQRHVAQALATDPAGTAFEKGLPLLSAVSWLGLALSAALMFGVCYLGVRRWQAPRAMWLPTLGASAAGLVTGLAFAASTFRPEFWQGSLSMAGLTLATPFLTALPPVAGVWFATRGDVSAGSTYPRPATIETSPTTTEETS